MRKTILKLFLSPALIIALQACSFTGASTPRTPSKAGVPITGGGSATPTATAPSTRAFTSTPSIVQARVSVPTNCRTGPGTAYEVVSGFFVGQVAEVVGRSANKKFWIIRDPNQHGELCWLAGDFVTLTGNADALPAFTTPPTPLPTIEPTSSSAMPTLTP